MFEFDEISLGKPTQQRQCHLGMDWNGIEEWPCQRHIRDDFSPLPCAQVPSANNEFKKCL